MDGFWGRRKAIKLIAIGSTALITGYLAYSIFGLFPSHKTIPREADENGRPTPSPTEDSEEVYIHPPNIQYIILYLTKEGETFILNTEASILSELDIHQVRVKYSYPGYYREDSMEYINGFYYDEEEIPFTEEGLLEPLKVEIEALDEMGNRAVRTRHTTFFGLLNKFDSQPPRIESINMFLNAPDKLVIEAIVNDDSLIKNVEGFLKLNDRPIFIRFQKAGQNTYTTQVSLPIQEQTITLTLTAKDILGKESNKTVTQAYVDMLKQIDQVIPSITYSIEFISTDTLDALNIEYTANDDVKLKNAEVRVNGEKLEDMVYHLDTQALKPITIEFIAEDLAGNIARKTISYSVEELLQNLFKSYTQNLNFDLTDKEIKELLSIFSIVQTYRNYQTRRNIETILNYYIGNREAALQIFKTLEQALIGIIDRAEIFSQAVKYLNQVERYTLNTVQAEGLIKYVRATVPPYSLAMNQDALTTLINILENEENVELIRFEPLTFKSVDGNDITLNPDLPRETYTMAEFLHMLKQDGIDIANYPELREAINMKIFANNWSIYDAEYGINYHEDYRLRPDSQEVKDLIYLQWQHLKRFTPQFGDSSLLYNRSFPWYNSEELKQLYPDQTNRRQALFLLFILPSGTYNIEKGQIEVGLEGAKTSITQSSYYYEIITDLYPDGKVGRWDDDPRWFYYAWIVDRGCGTCGSKRAVETCKQFVDLYAEELHSIITQHPQDFLQYILQYDGIDQFLHKHTTYGQYWDLAKFIMGYARWLGGIINIYEEWGINFLIPDFFRYFGYPVVHTYIHKNPPGTSIYEWAISLPENVIADLKTNFGSENLVIGHGNTFGLYNCKAGLVQDGVKRIALFLGSKSPMLEHYLYPEILAYLYYKQ